MPPACFAQLNPATYQPHPLHDPARPWPQTNCYVDVWIEIVAQLGLPPQAMMPFTLTQDFEGDQFTFFKVPLEDLERLYGIRVGELAIFDPLLSHVTTQLERGRLCLIELDSFFLPDTAGLTYHSQHGKTTIAINRLDCAASKLEYFHNDGYFALEGADFAGLFALDRPDDLFLPYSEFAKFDDVPASRAQPPKALREASLTLLRHHLRRRPRQNPIRAFAACFADQARALADRAEGHFHLYAFNTLRQLGANFALLADCLHWLEAGFAQEAQHAETIATLAKTVQFQLARALARRKFEPLTGLILPAADHWDQLMQALETRLGPAP